MTASAPGYRDAAVIDGVVGHLRGEGRFVRLSEPATNQLVIEVLDSPFSTSPSARLLLSFQGPGDVWARIEGPGGPVVPRAPGHALPLPGAPDEMIAWLCQRLLAPGAAAA